LHYELWRNFVHIILGLLGAIVTILILFNRLSDAGITLSSFNPFLWNRRRQWKKQYQGNPIFNLQEPKDLTAMLMVGLAKMEGDMSKEQKDAITSQFQQEFHMSNNEAMELLTSSVHLHGRGDEIKSQVDKVIQPSINKFTSEQAESALNLLNQVSKLEGDPSESQTNLINTFKSICKSNVPKDTTWG
jgi:hypothetical protein